jgi:hypothetical protein
MSRSARLQKKLLSRHLLQVAEDVVTNEGLINFLWGFKQGESFNITVENLDSEPLSKYKLQYTVTRGPIPEHWLYKAFEPNELELFFTAKDYESISHGWLLFNEQ